MASVTYDKKPTAPEDAKELEKAQRNAEYLAMIDKAVQDIDNGKGVAVTMEQLEAMANG
ncbi:MAG: hypothetical protein LBU16_07380 [Treponema sp.]|nr:hypothetical protein [Treponema sp.]